MPPCRQENTKSGKLLIQVSAGESGTRPLDPCNNFWTSPDISLSIKQGSAFTGAFTQVHVNDEAKVNVTVKNVSAQPIGHIDVEAFVCDYTLGALGPNHAVPGTPSFLGSKVRLGPNTAAVIECSEIWKPTSTQAQVNGGHVCLAANVFADPPDDGVSLGSTGEINVCCDSHHGQCNIAILPAVALKDGSGYTVEQGTGIINPPDTERTLRLIATLERVTGPDVLGAAERALLGTSAFADLSLAPSRYEPLDVSIRSDYAEPGAKVALTIPPGERTQLSLTAILSPEEQPGSLHVFDAVSRDAATGDVVGGNRLLVVVPTQS